MSLALPFWRCRCNSTVACLLFPLGCSKHFRLPHSQHGLSFHIRLQHHVWVLAVHQLTAQPPFWMLCSLTLFHLVTAKPASAGLPSCTLGRDCVFYSDVSDLFSTNHTRSCFLTVSPPSSGFDPSVGSQTRILVLPTSQNSLLTIFPSLTPFLANSLCCPSCPQ